MADDQVRNMTVSNGVGKDAALVSTPGPGPRKIRPAFAKARYYPG